MAEQKGLKTEEVTKLISRQDEIHAEVESVMKNHRKAGSERKTKAYYEKRVKQLQDLGEEFQKNDEYLQNPSSKQQTSEYRSKNMDVTVKTAVESYISSLKTELKELLVERAATPAQSTAGSTTIQSMIRRQNVMMSSLTRAMKLVVVEEVESPSFKMKQKLWEEIQNLHFKIGEATDSPTELGYSMDAYAELEAEVLPMLHDVCHSSVVSRAASQQNFGHVPLPKIEIPKFDGDYGKWQTFHDLFLKVVHEQPISAVQKMWCLKTNVVGEAEGLIRHLSLTEANYEAAWNLLKDRFSNKRVVSSKILQRMIECNPINSDAGEIKMFHDTIRESLLALENVGISTKGWDPMLLQILVKKLDRYTHGLYEASILNPKEVQEVDHFLKFLEQRFQTLESLGPKEKRGGFSRATAAAINLATCKICNSKDHPIYFCRTFLEMSPKRRFQMAQTNKLCINCLKTGHGTKQCTSRPCKHCEKRHNSLLHFEDISNDTSSTSSAVVITDNTAEAPQSVLASSNTANELRKSSNYVLLATAKVRIVARNGQTCEARAVLDAGSQVNLITQRLVNRLSLSTTKSGLVIEGVGQHIGKATARVNSELQSTVGEYSTRFEAFVMPQIVSPQPSIDLDITHWNMPDVTLADPSFYTSSKIDILIGAEHYHQLMQPQQFYLGNSLPLLQNTELGWIVIGKTRVSGGPSASCAIYSSPEEQRVSEIMERFWTTEEVKREEEFMNATDKICEDHFSATMTRNGEGRFVVRLPFADNPSVLGNSQMQAEKRFQAIERKFRRDPEVKKDYVKFMQEYEILGHMQKVDTKLIPATNYFIPHHCVIKPDSTTTKLRVVFDASAKTSSGTSLNDILQNGPTVQSELFSTLLRFRMHKYVFTADIEKMYRQVLMHPDDANFQFIVWRTQESEPYQYYKLNTVTYGTTSAPYLATKCLQQLARQSKEKFPLGSEVVENDFYVDDCLSGANSITVARDKQKQATELLKEAGFKLRKWCANDQRLLSNVPLEDQEVNLDLDTSEPIKTLGVIWRPKTDELCDRARISAAERLSKRIIASELAKIYDPLGIFGPITVTAKIFMQQLWELQVAWDDEIPSELQHQWQKFREDLSEINDLEIPRHIFSGTVPTSYQIHTFTDASERTFGAAVYIRAINPDNLVSVRLLCAKSRIAPLKRLTLPRLELCAAMLGAELTNRVRIDLDAKAAATFFWSDSEIVLSWIQSPSATLHTFVANRVAKIHRLSDAAQWHHVPSKENPADLLSRGTQPRKLGSGSPWFYGPLFFHRGTESWLQPGPRIPEFDGDIERRTRRVVTIVSQPTDTEAMIQRIHHRNSFQFLHNTVGYLRRPFVCPKPQHVSLSPAELRQALVLIVRAIQSTEFKQELNDLRLQRGIAHTSQLSALAPFIDSEGVLRVGGRLEAAGIQYDAKHPMVLPYNEPIVKLLFKLVHEENKHCGVQSLMAAMRQRFWPIKGKITARSIVHKCILCSRAKPKLFGQVMGNLPADRVNVARPFLNSGVDYCGPFSIHYKVRGKKPTKAYLAIFCCFSTKAVHLELVTDLSTKSFLGALSRFISRRGRCKTIHCDNATNFVGAKNQLTELYETIFSKEAQESIIRNSSSKGIEFKFIPPRGPHFGGLWEAAVKSAKYLLTRDVSSANLTYEELETVVIGIEAILNSRPLTPLSADPNDLAALTPGHFLIGEPLTAIAEQTQDNLNANIVQRWELVSKIKYEFWRRWSTEYLNELQHRHKWRVASANAQPGDMVILKDDNLPVMEWQIGKIEKIYLGDDGRVRVADVRTPKGTYKRLIHLLAPLPTASPLNAQVEPSVPSHTPDNDVDNKSAQRPEDYLPNKRQRMASPYSG